MPKHRSVWASIQRQSKMLRLCRAVRQARRIQSARLCGPGRDKSRPYGASKCGKWRCMACSVVEVAGVHADVADHESVDDRLGGHRTVAEDREHDRLIELSLARPRSMVSVFALLL